MLRFLPATTKHCKSFSLLLSHTPSQNVIHHNSFLRCALRTRFFLLYVVFGAGAEAEGIIGETPGAQKECLERDSEEEEITKVKSISTKPRK